MRINVPTRANRKLATLVERVNDDTQLKAWWHVANVNAVERLEINDHSWVHIQIVTNIALKLLRQLTKHGVEPAMVRDYGMSRATTPRSSVTLGALLHCIGMSVHRDGHEDFSLFLAEPKMRELLDGLYDEPERTRDRPRCSRDHEPPRVRQAAHPRSRDRPRRGRARHGEGPLAHPVRARPRVHPLALRGGDRQTCTSSDGDERADLIEIVMNNSSGIYQVDELLKAKLRGSGLEPYVEVVAHIDTEAEKSLVPLYRLETLSAGRPLQWPRPCGVV